MRSRFRFLLFCLFCSAANGQIEVTVYGDDSYPPYSYVEQGNITGIYTIILHRIFTQMPEYDVTLEGRPWKRSLFDISQGDIFALYPPYKRIKQRPYMEYDLPILDEVLIVVCQDTVLTLPRPSWPTDYFGLTIGSNLGFSSGGDEFREAVKAGSMKSEEVKGTPNNLLKLIAGRIDCYMNDALSIRWELKQLELEGQYDGKGLKKGTIISSEQGFLGFVANGQKFPYKEHFKSQYLEILIDMKNSGEIEDIVNKYLQ